MQGRKIAKWPIIFLLCLSFSLIAEQARDDADYAENSDGDYLIDDSDAGTLIDSELTLEGERALNGIREANTKAPDEGDAKDGKLAIDSLAMQGLDAEVQALKEDVLFLNRELFSLEEELLFPSNTQFAVYVSVDVGEFFDMESVRVLLDNKPVASYLYTKRESDALMRGGVHRIYMGNLSAGRHELVAYYTGRGPRGRDFKRATTRTVNKEIGPKYIELKISDNAGKKQAGFEVKEW